ncbi:DUF222 domain-containing protein [Paeniglutamicibacter antarcticus]|uniref:DUF222 domain-containing protein n=1 Tax=Arthrobacter terrae TaxID=2935737 RepID=A0A931GCD8_9MICC|nr:DUF222 domain-containing protein [Arthrobacter terrae]MBG0741627.1 DUF222 domain-containing protein [Arthrobacter terrae]
MGTGQGFEALLEEFLKAPDHARPVGRGRNAGRARQAGRGPAAGRRPAAEDVATPGGRPAAEDVAAPGGGPTADDAGEPGGRPAAEDVAAPGGRPAAEDVAAPGGRPAAEDVAAPGGRPAAEDVATPGGRPAAEDVAAPGGGPAADDAGEPGGGRRVALVRRRGQLQKRRSGHGRGGAVVLDLVWGPVKDVVERGLWHGQARSRTLLAAVVCEEAPAVLDPVAVATALAVLDPAGGGADDFLDYAGAAGKLICWAQAVQARAVAAFATVRPPLPEETPRSSTVPARSEWISERSKHAAAEVGAVLHMSSFAAQRLMDQSEYLTRLLPATLALQEQGILDKARVQAVFTGLATTPAHLWPQVDAVIAGIAPSLEPRALERRARATAEKLDPEPLTARHERARTARDVWFTPQADPMADIGAHLSAVDARRLYETIDAWAHRAQQEGGPSTASTPGGKPSRAINEYRADVFTDVFDLNTNPNTGNPDTDTDTGNPDDTGTGGTNAGDGTGTGGTSAGDGTGTGGANAAAWLGGTGTGGAGGAGVRRRRWAPAQIAVTVPVLTLLGVDDKPAVLNGYGPIPLETARLLAGTATSWLRILTDPETGTILSIGRRQHDPPADLKRWIITRDQTCRGIGCDKPARDCEIDHTIPYNRQTYAPDGTPLPLGETSDTNLGPFCTTDHHLKDNPGTGWTVTQPSPGTFIHTSPTGRTYTKNPQPPPF